MAPAYCGIECDTCPIHSATLETDSVRRQEMRTSIAEQCSKYYGIAMLPEEVTDCDGCCCSSGRLFSGCSKCEIRPCAISRNIENCASCKEYACDLLIKHFSLDPEAKKRLDGIRSRNNF